MTNLRTGYDALEALTDGTITAEEMSWLKARAAESPEWAAAMKAHAPLGSEATDKMVGAILDVVDEQKVVPIRSRRWLAGAGAAIAAGVLMFALMKPGVPSYSVSQEGAGMCTGAVVRSGTDVGDCRVFVLRPETAVSREVSVKAFDKATGAELEIAHTKMVGDGVIHVYLSAEDALKNVEFKVE